MRGPKFTIRNCPKCGLDITERYQMGHRCNVDDGYAVYHAIKHRLSTAADLPSTVQRNRERLITKQPCPVQNVVNGAVYDVVGCFLPRHVEMPFDCTVPSRVVSGDAIDQRLDKAFKRVNARLQPIHLIPPFVRDVFVNHRRPLSLSRRAFMAGYTLSRKVEAVTHD